MSNKDSLFSLELVVDEIYIQKVACRFPVIAFRLLDFPTIVINHVEPEIAEGMKKKIALDSLYEVPNQFNELKNRHGKFVVRKGKSCLYKISADTLRSHLETAPLYVMVLDMYESVAKLVGNCTVPLHKTAEAIYSDIMTEGITLPSVHGARGTYKLYSLIGNEIGYITLAHRLLSLGPGLLSHIPSTNIVTARKPVTTAPKAHSAEVAESKLDSFVQQIVTNEEVIPVAYFVASPREKQTQTIQTESVAVQRGNWLKKEQLNVEDDMFITNIVCPPALFYNSKCETPAWNKTIPTYDKTTNACPETIVVNYGSDSSESDSDVDTIGEPGETGIDISQQKREELVHAQKQSVMRSAQKLLGEAEERKSALKISEQSQMAPVNALGNILNMAGGQNLPILNALMSELNLLTSAVNSGQGTQANVPQQVIKKASIAQQNVASDKQDNKENMKLFVKRMAVPKKKRLAQHKENVERYRKLTIVEPEPKIPANKSWLRQTPVYSQRKTKLSYGLTNTQRLRLAKNNPALLKTIEDQEKEESIPDEFMGQEVNFDHLGMSDDLTDMRGVGDGGDMAMTKVIKRPVPTPRSHPHLDNFEHVTPCSPVTAVQSHREDLSYKSAKSEKSCSIEVRLPSASLHDDSTSQYSSAMSDAEIDMTKTRVVNAPGFPSDNESDSGRAAMGQTKVVVASKRSAPVQKPVAKTRQVTQQKSQDAVPSPRSDRTDEDYSEEWTKEDDTASQSDEEINLPQYVDKYDDTEEWNSTAHSELKVSVKDSDESEVTYHSMRSSISRKTDIQESPKSQGSQKKSARTDIKSDRSDQSDVLKSEMSHGSKAKIPPINPVLSSRSPVVGAVRRPSLTKQRDSLDSIDTPRRVAKRDAIKERKARLQVMHDRESFNTDSLSSYAPSDPDNIDITGLGDDLST